MIDAKNPYAVLPDTKELLDKNPPTSLTPQVEPTGTFLVLSSDATLPDRCIYTNEPTGPDDVIEETLTWTGRPFRLCLRARSCTLQYSVMSDVRHAKKKLRNQLYFIGVPLGLGTMWIFKSWLVLAALFLLPHAIDNWISRKTGPTPPVTIADFRDDRFWITGCSPKFLLQLREELNL